ncbi:translocation/assembly module TamB domain-containing protein [Variovorax sp. OV329]|uniref:translocation/assembly module TamB domain-containing protein n=1 Tax=Variovorax sp. OV329 TaxID=1882825 RepID=UPI0008F24661|nr:translocation/assembly module TamB domain-containing protein [Variovorax sp. OV329]SFM74209.1 autotransporter secretion inner membrane protein TamB [Variovorax sp. OV329]
MNDDASPSSTANGETPRPRSRARRVARGLAWSFASLLVVLALALAGAWWWLGSNQSLAFALAQAARYLPADQQLTHENVEGSLLAGGHIGRLRWQSPGMSVELTDATLGWHWPSLLRRRLQLGEVHIAQVDIAPIGPKPENSPPPEPLQQLLLPLAIELPFKVDRLRWAGPPEVVATGLAGRYAFEGGEHQLDVDGVDLADGHYSAKARLQGAAPMDLDVKLDGKVQAPLDAERRIEVQARASLRGPLAGADARLQLDAEIVPTEEAAGMQARVHAELAPWQAQPLVKVDALLQDVDLARLWPEAPATRLSGEVHAGPAATLGALGWEGTADLRNADPGPWDEGQLPIARLQAQASFDGSEWVVPQLRIDAGGGRIEGSGSWRPAPEPWQARLEVKNLRLGELHTQLDGAPVEGKLEAQQKEGGRIDFAVDLRARGGAGARAARDSLEGLAIERVTARGLWQDALLTLSNLQVDAAGAQLEGKLRARPEAKSGDGTLRLTLPGAEVNAQADMAPSKGQGQVNARIDDAAALQAWIERLPGLADALAGLALQGNGTLDARFTGGWQTLQQRLTAPEQAMPRGVAEPTLSAQLVLPRLSWQPEGASGEERWQLRDLRASVDGSLARARIEVDGEAVSPIRQVTLQLKGSGGQERARQWRAEVASLTAQLRPNARNAPPPWKLVLQRTLSATIRTSGGDTDGTLQMDGSGGAAIITGPQPGSVRLEWQPTRFSRSGPPTRRALRLQSAGKMQGLPMAWADAVGAGSLSEMGVSGDLLFEGDWDVDAGDRLRAHVRLARASGDLRVQAGEAAMVTRVHSTGTGTAEEITTDADASGRNGASTPAGLKQAELVVDAEGDALRARLVWDSERAGVLKAQASTRLARDGAGWRWPENAPLAGQLEARMPRLGVWSMLAPPGWRINGTLDANLTLSGSRDAPTWNGRLAADELGLRSAVEGLDLRDGRLRATLSGRQLTVDDFTLSGGPGSRVRIPGRSGNLSTAASEAAADGGRLTVRGNARWGEPTVAGGSGIRMDMQGEIRSLRVLVRSDRQVTLSGDLQVRLQDRQITVRGKLRTDRGVIILPPDTAPSLGTDVVVRSAARERAAAEAAARTRERGAQQQQAQAQAVNTPQTPRPADIQVELDLGKDFAVQGRGITTRLEGQLDIRAVGAGSPPRITGEVRTVNGVYRAYGQQLNVETGIARFNGPFDNPQLDVLAIRPNISQRAGVQISGTASAPRVKLYSEPPLSDAETLSWIMLGRASASNGGEAILMQQAALALLGRFGADSSTGNLASRFGLDEIGFKGPSPNGELQESSVTLGKRLSQDFYVTYERSMAGTLGTFFIFYDLTQRLTLRGQAGEHYGADLIYTIKFDRLRGR